MAGIEWTIFISKGLSLPRLISQFELMHGMIEIPFLGRVIPSRIYFGNEFCQHLIPTLEEVKSAYNLAIDLECSFTLVTPYVTEDGLKKLIPLFEFLSNHTKGVEIVINDWGVMNLIHREYPSLVLVLGRLMNKMPRDPRVTRHYNIPGVPKDALAFPQQSNVTIQSYRTLLKSYGINRVELDNVFQGIDMDFNKLELEASIYISYGYVTTGRICLSGNLNLTREKKFVSGNRCSKECQRYEVSLSNTNSIFEDKDLILHHVGNTVFYSQEEDMVLKAVEGCISNGINRIIYQPAIPM